MATTRWRATCAYVGTDLEGWQSQPSGNAVQDHVEKRLAEILGGPVRIHGSLAAIAFRYAVAPAIEAAIKKTGKADRKAIRDALEEVDVPNTPVGRVKLDDTHQAFINMLLVEINGGQLKVLEKIPIQP